MVAKDKAGEIIDDAKENIEDMFYSATTAATAFVFSATGIIDEALDGIRNLAVIKTASEIKEDVKNKLTSGINDLLGGAFDVKAVSTANGIEINIGKDFCLEVGCPMNADKMKDIKNWTIDAVFDDEKHDTEKIKNVIDTQTLGNIREVSETLYNDLLEMIIKDGESAESIIDIVDCINNDTEEFKKAYDFFGDVEKAYKYVSKTGNIEVPTEPTLPIGSKPMGEYTNKSSKGLIGQDHAADVLADAGYDVYMLKDVDGGNGHGIETRRNPDFLITNQYGEKIVFDCYTPKCDTITNLEKKICNAIQKKTNHQTDRIILNLKYYPFENCETLKSVILRKTSITQDLKKLKELIVILPDEKIECWFLR